MIRTVHSAFRRRPMLFAAFGLALAVTLFFAVRMVMFTLYWADPAHRNQGIEGWMTPRYVAHSWQVPPEVVATALDLEPGSRRGRTLQDLAEDRDVPLSDLVDGITLAIDAHRSGARQ